MITLRFCSSKKILSKLIRWYDHGEYSHVDSILSNGKQLGAMIKGGVKIRDFIPDKYIFVNIDVDEKTTKKYYDGLRMELGKPYDITAILAFFMNRNWRDPKRWFCSELVTAKLIEAGVFNSLIALPIKKIDPTDLLLMLNVLPNVTFS